MYRRSNQQIVMKYFLFEESFYKILQVLCCLVSYLSISTVYALSSDEFNKLRGLQQKDSQAHALTVSEFNQLNELKDKQEYEQFREQWCLFLQNKQPASFINLQPSLARKATEEYLILQGGLLARIGKASQNNSYAFTFTRPADESEDRTASFHRAKRGIFTDLENISGQQWLFNFIHEVAHSLDSEMYESLGVYNNLDYMKQLEQWGLNNRQYDELSLDEKAQLRKWLIAALNRGFLGEYRAWLLSYYAYAEGKSKKVISGVVWMDDLLNFQPQNMKVADYVFHFLSPKWKDPEIGLFKYSFLLIALRKLRAEFDQNPDLVKLGQIGELLNSK